MQKAEPIFMQNVHKFTREDLARFYFRFSGYLIAIGEYKKCWQKWLKANNYHVDFTANAKLLTKVLLKCFKIDRKAENILWKYRTKRKHCLSG